MSDDRTELIEELDLLRRLPAKRSLTNRNDLRRITRTEGSLTDLHGKDLVLSVKELEANLDSMLGSIKEYQGFLSRTKGRI